MTTDIKHKIKLLSIGLLVIVILGYSYFRTKDLIFGIQLTVEGITQNESYATQILEITGNAKRATKITINDRAIFITEEGDFTEQLLLIPGYNIIDIQATDRFGKTKEKVFTITFSEATTP